MKREEINREWYEAIETFKQVKFLPEHLGQVETFIRKLTYWLDAVNDDRNRLQDRVTVLERENAALKDELARLKAELWGNMPFGRK